jgi:hypothetical protein
MTEAQLKVEQVKAGRMAYLIHLIDAIGSFTGVAAHLEVFLMRMDATKKLLDQNKMDEVTNLNLHYLFIARISEPVLIKLGIRFSMTWEEVKRRLRERYVGARRPVQRDAVKIARLRREPRESPSDFASRVGDEYRALAKKIEESCTDPVEVTWRRKIYEEMFQEVLAVEVPERVRDKLRGAQPGSLEEAVAFVNDQEIEREETRRDEGTAWTKVEHRRPRPPPREWRPTPRPIRPQKERSPLKRQRMEERTPARTTPRRDVGRERRPTHPRRECWECGAEGHFARECPWIYRREKKSYAEAARGEEYMEVNAGRIPRAGAPRRYRIYRSEPEESYSEMSEDDRSVPDEGGQEQVKTATKA